MAVAVLFLLLVAAVDRAAENCRWVLPSQLRPTAKANVSAPKGIAPEAQHAPTPIPTPVALRTPAPASTPTPNAPAEEAPAERAAWSYFHPFWNEDFRPAVGKIYPPRPDAAGSAKLIRILDDPKHRLEKEFQVPYAMRDRVLFWMQVHSRFDTRMRLIHDRLHPEIVYGYADFTDVYEAADSRAKGDAIAFRFEREIVNGIKARLAEASGFNHTDLLTPWERVQLFTLLSRGGALNREGLAHMINNVRSQTGQRDEFLAALERSEELLPFIEMEFSENELPAELSHIPFVESAFNWHARSKVGAMGIFQFMPQTARQMIGGDPANWADPIRQTRGAVRLFQIFRSMVPDWSTAITSYNSGAGRLKYLCQKYRTKSVVKLLDVSDGSGLGFAGKNFYAQFLSANLVENYKLEIFPELRRKKEEDYLVFHNVAPFAREFRNTF